METKPKHNLERLIEIYNDEIADLQCDLDCPDDDPEDHFFDDDQSQREADLDFYESTLFYLQKEHASQNEIEKLKQDIAFGIDRENQLAAMVRKLYKYPPPKPTSEKLQAIQAEILANPPKFQPGDYLFGVKKGSYFGGGIFEYNVDEIIIAFIMPGTDHIEDKGGWWYRQFMYKGDNICENNYKESELFPTRELAEAYVEKMKGESK